MSVGKVWSYAFNLVLDGAESTREDDMNEDGELTDEEHERALGTASEIIRIIRVNEGAILALASKAVVEIVWGLGQTGDREIEVDRDEDLS